MCSIGEEPKSDLKRIEVETFRVRRLAMIESQGKRRLVELWAGESEPRD